MRRLLVSAVLSACGCAGLSARPAFPAVAPEVWKLTESDSAGKGAIVLEKDIRVDAGVLEVRMQIRILGAAGRGAAEFATFGSDCFNIEGRTLQPDGQVIPFAKKDMISKTFRKSGSTDVERTVVVPPGITDNCIVELRWKQFKKYNSDPWGFGHLERISLSGAYPVRKLVLEIPESLIWLWNLQTPGAGKVQHEVEKFTHRFTLEDLPPLENPPYSLEGTRQACRLLLYPMPGGLRHSATRGPDAYWDEVGQLVVKPYLEEDLRKGKTYRELLARLSTGLPAEPGIRAAELLKRLEGAVRNTTFATEAEKALQGTEEVNPRDLERAARTRATTGLGMRYLFFALAKDLGLKPLVALVEDRDKGIFERRLLTWQQFTDVLIGVAGSSGDILWFDPWMRYAPPGVIDQDYQGTPALMFDSDAWKPRAFHLPMQSAAVNLRQYDYAFDLGENEDRFSLKASFAGLPEYEQRLRYLPLGQSDQNRLLQDRLENQCKEVVITKAAVLHATDPTQNLAWEVEGRVERTAGRKRTVDPFPANAGAFWIPDHLEPVRKEAIVFPFASVFQETSTLRIPKGWQPVPTDSLDQSNGFGKVTWTMEPAGPDSIRIRVRVELDRPVGSAADHEAFRTFLDWVREACGRSLTLERS